MIKVHNFYTDLLLSMRYLFDNIVFGPGKIKHYMFNIGNKSFQLEYKSQYELPACIINYQSSSAIKYHSWLIQNTGLNNHNLIPILYNKNKQLTLQLQEEEYSISLEVLLNFDSQFAGMEYEHRIKSNMPIGKPLQLYHFYTFYEIPDMYLNHLMFDVNYDDIVNLYTKYDNNLDKIIHCASVRYEPLIKLESCQLGIGSIDQRSFQLAMQFSLDISVPIYFQIPFDELPIIRNVETIRELETIVPVSPDISLLEVVLKDDEKYNKFAIPIKNDNKYFNNIFSFNDIDECRVIGEFSDLYIEYGDIRITNLSKYEESISSYKYTCQDTTSLELKISGPLTGKFKYFKKSDNIIDGLFYGDFNHVHIEENLKGEYKMNSCLHDMNSSPHIIFPSNEDYSYETRILPYTTPKKSLKKINPNTVKFKPQNTELIGLTVLNNCSNKSKYYKLYDKLDDYGNFNIQFYCKDTTSLNNITGKIHPKTMELSYNVDVNSDLLLASLHFNFAFDTIPIFGSRVISNIDLSIVGNSLEPILIGTNVSIIKDEFNRDLHEYNIKKLCSRIIIPDVIDDIDQNFKIFDDFVLCKVQFDEYFDIYNKMMHEQSYWRFIFNGIVYTPSDLIQYIQIKNYVIEFKIDKQLYYTKFSKYTMMNPIFFEIFRQV